MGRSPMPFDPDDDGDDPRDDDPQDELGGPTEIPMEALSEGALMGVLDDYILREGTDYGHRDVDLDEKRATVIGQLRRGDARIVFDPESQSVTLLRKEGSGRRRR